MKLSGVRYAEATGEPTGRRNVTFGVIQHLWRSPVPFVGFYTPEDVTITQNRRYVPTPPRLVDDSEYLAAVESHKKTYAKDLEKTMVPAGSLRGYFEVPTDEGWRLSVDLIERKLDLSDAWGMATRRTVDGDLAPFVWAYRNSGFCIVTIYDKDIGALRDDLLFVAKREGVELLWGPKAA
ncbi:MAG: hypothetical protein WA990_13660 [Rubrobacteraceae bacterium]